MQYFAKLFTKVPFDLLEIHMEKVFTCLLLLKKMLLMAYAIKKEDAWDFYAEDIANIGHEADLVKNDIRVALPHSSSSTRALLEILTIQDDLADTAEESSSLLIMKSLSFPQEVKADFFDYVAKNIEAATLVKDIVFKLDALGEASFRGPIAHMVHKETGKISYKGHESKILQIKLSKVIFCGGQTMTFQDFYLIIHVIELVGKISRLSEKLALRIKNITKS